MVILSINQSYKKTNTALLGFMQPSNFKIGTFYAFS